VFDSDLIDDRGEKQRASEERKTREKRREK
jgi:hypothetical protein